MIRVAPRVTLIMLAGCAQPPTQPQPQEIPEFVKQSCGKLSEPLLMLAVGGIESHLQDGVMRADSVRIANESCEYVCGSGECEDRCEACIENVHKYVYDGTGLVCSDL